VDASYPSGHTAASIAVYCGLALLLTSHIRFTPARVLIWAVAGAMPLFVAFARMARGMHHPIDCAAGAAIGIAALCVMVFASRAAGHAAERRDAGHAAERRDAGHAAERRRGREGR
jgi:undecaprenyl-diphosphatase